MKTKLWGFLLIFRVSIYGKGEKMKLEMCVSWLKRWNEFGVCSKLFILTLFIALKLIKCKSKLFQFFINFNKIEKGCSICKNVNILFLELWQFFIIESCPSWLNYFDRIHSYVFLSILTCLTFSIKYYKFILKFSHFISFQFFFRVKKTLKLFKLSQ